MLASMPFLLMIFESESGCLGLENHVFGLGSSATIIFHRSWISHDARVELSLFEVALGPVFITFVALETRLKFGEFST